MTLAVSTQEYHRKDITKKLALELTFNSFKIKKQNIANLHIAQCKCRHFQKRMKKKFR